MSGFRYEKHKVKPVHILGKDLECREPTLSEQAFYEKALRERDPGDDVTEMILDFMVKLGVPKDLSNEMPLPEVLALLTYLRGGDLDKKK